MKLKKIENNFYIISDDEIKEGDWVCYRNISIHTAVKDDIYRNYVKKITHSTQKLEPECSEHNILCGDFGERKCIYPHCKRKIIPLDINEIEELIYGYSVEKMADYHWRMQYIMALDESIKPYIIEDYKSGFKAAMEINKDKLFTEKDMRVAISFAWNFGQRKENNLTDTGDKIINSLLSKTEWDVEFVDGKIKLI